MGGIVEGIGDVLSDPFGKKSGNQAVAAQKDATAEANRIQKEMFDIQRNDQQPWRQAGMAALTQMQDPSLMKNFTAGDFQQDPGYQFRMGEGQKALERSAAARGGLMGGGTMKALTQYGQNFASNEYQNAYNRFNNDRDSRFNKLSSLAGVGQVANNQIGQAAGNYGNAVSQNQLNLGNAQAGNIVSTGANMRNLLAQGAGAAAAAFSDERLKTNIEPISKEDLNELKQTIKPYKFNYISQDFGKGDYIGVMAQDLEKTKLGKTIVEENEQGQKYISGQKLMCLLLATMAEA